VNDKTITAKDLEQGIGVSLSQLEEQIYELKRRELAVPIARRNSMSALHGAPVRGPAGRP
jgi:hypothetical protein